MLVALNVKAGAAFRSERCCHFECRVLPTAASCAVAFRCQSIACHLGHGCFGASALGSFCVSLPSRVRASYKHAVCLWLVVRAAAAFISAASYAVAFRRRSVIVPGRPGMLWASALGTICVGLPRVRASYKHAVCLWPSSCGLTQLSGRSAVVTSSAGCC